jgi:hypothetical protein
MTSSAGLNVDSLASTLGMKIGVTIRAESRHEHEIQQRETHRNWKKITVPANKYGLNCHASFRFDLGFKRYFTVDNGVSWQHTDHLLPIEIWLWPQIFSLKEDECYSILDQRISMFLRERVKRWLSDTLERGGLDSLNC